MSVSWVAVAVIVAWALSFGAGIWIAVRAAAWGSSCARCARNLFVAVWLFACVLGVVVAIQQGPGVAGVMTTPPMHPIHSFSGKLVEGAIWAALFFLTPLAVARGAQTKWWGWMVLQIASSLIVIILIQATGFTGYLGGGSSVDEQTFQRFRILHEIALPMGATIFVAIWFLISRRLWDGEGRKEG